MSIENTPIGQNDTLRSFLQEELEDASHRLDLVEDRIAEQNAGGIKAWFKRLRGRISDVEYKSLRAELEDKNNRLKDLPDDDVRLFLLRKEIGILKEEVQALGAGQKWHIPLAVWVGILLLLIFIYFLSLSVIQGRNQEMINDFATQTAEAMPTPDWTPTPNPTTSP